MRFGGWLLAEVAEELKAAIVPGMKATDLNRLAESLIFQKDGKPVFKGYKGFPAAICVSVNEELVHGIPQNKEFKKGDIVSVDMGFEYKELITDMAFTIPVVKTSKKAMKLMATTEAALAAGIEAVKPGGHVGDIGAAVQERVERDGFSVVKTLVGHGVGHEIHEDPAIPNYGIPGEGVELVEGMTIAIEPMVNLGKDEVKLQDDGWTFSSKDKKLTAHFEHTVAVTSGGYEILTKKDGTVSGS